MTPRADEFSTADGITLARAYLEDPSSVPCPRCGPDKIEVAAFLDTTAVERGEVRFTAPEGQYTALIYCHGCERAAALELSRGDEAREVA